MASANRPDRGQSEVRNGETEAGQDAPTNISVQRTEQHEIEDSANLPDPDIIAAEIVEDLQAALAQFAEIANDLKP